MKSSLFGRESKLPMQKALHKITKSSNLVEVLSTMLIKTRSRRRLKLSESWVIRSISRPKTLRWPSPTAVVLIMSSVTATHRTSSPRLRTSLPTCLRQVLLKTATVKRLRVARRATKLAVADRLRRLSPAKTSTQTSMSLTSRSASRISAAT